MCPSSLGNDRSVIFAFFRGKLRTAHCVAIRVCGTSDQFCLLTKLLYCLPYHSCIGVMCKIGKLHIPGRGTIQYQIFRPRQLEQNPPLVVLHGGPMIPCNYLLPLAYVVVDRAVVFYDQLGCGQSSTVVGPGALTKQTTTPADDSNKEDSNTLDVDSMVQDFQKLLHHWKFPKFHLLGHSFGGLLAFEYLKYVQIHNLPKEHECVSLVLASVPTSAKIVEEEVQRLCQELALNGEISKDEHGQEDEGVVASLAKNLPQAFREQHECRLVPIPFPLMDSYDKAGPPKLRGLQSIETYAASLLVLDASESPTEEVSSESATKGDESNDNQPKKTPTSKKLKTPVLILRGQHDFVTEACVKGWDDLFRDRSYMTLAGCSHYGMLENEVMYGSVVSSFMGEIERSDD